MIAFPTLDGKVVAGPTAHDQDDKGDWRVRASAEQEIRERAARLLRRWAPSRSRATGAAPRGRGGANDVIAHSAALRGLVNVAAIRSTGLTASLGIAEYVSGLVGGATDSCAGPAASRPRRRAAGRRPWWARGRAPRGLRGGAGGVSAPAAARHRRGHDGRQGGPVRRSTARRVAPARRAVGVNHPQPGWVEKDRAEILEAVVETRRRGAARRARARRRVAGLDHQGESVLAWDARSGRR